jgi:hypothetical protein
VKYAFQWLAEHRCDAESRFQGWRIFSQLDCVHSLASEIDFVGQILLRHLSVLEAEPPDFVSNRPHGYAPRRYWTIRHPERNISAATRQNSRALVLKMIGGLNPPSRFVPVEIRTANAAPGKHTQCHPLFG